VLRKIDELRAELFDAIRSGEARWLRMNGLALEDGGKHRALTSSLMRCGIGGGERPSQLRTVVLDWSGVVVPSAGGLSAFAVLVQSLISAGLTVIVAEPDSPALTAIVSAALESLSNPYLRLLSSEESSRRVSARRFQLIDPVACFQSAREAVVVEFLSSATRILAERRVEPKLHKAIVAGINEVLLNISVHARCTVAVAVCVLWPARRPARLQFGFADNGQGIPVSIAGSGRYERLHWLHDVSGVSAVIGGARTSRAAGLESSAPGRGGLGHVLRRIRQTGKVELRLRSGAALLFFPPDASLPESRVHLDGGLGTIWQFEIRLP
jgi:hypothetical protein